MRAFVAHLKRRSNVEWGVRLLLTAVAGVIGYGAVAHSVARALPDQKRDQALRLAPHDAWLLAEEARAQMIAEAGRIPAARSNAEALSRLRGAEALAYEALKRDSTAIPAVTTLGTLAQLRGDLPKARRWMQYSERLSRRDLTTQLWLIEDAVGREDIAGALHHYDIALRVKRGASDLLFPVLTQASTDPEIAPKLVQTLSAKPVWGEQFIAFAASKTPTPAATARLFLALRRADVPISDAASGALIEALITKGQVEEAWAYFSQIRPHADRTRSRDPNFTAAVTRASHFDWVTAGDGSGLFASIQRSGDGGLLDFAAPAGASGTLVWQLQMLPAGRYLLEGQSIGIDQPARSRPYWLLTCRADGRELGRVTMPNSAENNGRFVGQVTVPPGCSAQMLVFIAPGSDEVGGLTGQIEHVQLRPAQ
jgi:hypothetical protein